VRSSTLDSTGKVLRLLTARLTMPSPRARFSCITESFTSLELPLPADRPDYWYLFLSSHSVVIIMVWNRGIQHFFPVKAVPTDHAFGGLLRPTEG
jgi:hypothetical protein